MSHRTSFHCSLSAPSPVTTVNAGAVWVTGETECRTASMSASMVWGDRLSFGR